MTKRALLIGGAIILVALPATYFAYAATLGVSSSKVTIYKSDASIAVPSPSPSPSPSPVSLTGSCTLTPTKDTYVSEAAPGSSFATADPLLVRSEKSGNNRRTFFMFDPSACVIPSGATMKSAVLTLTLSPAATSNRDYLVHRVAATWAEAMTWTAQPQLGSLTGQVNIPNRATTFSGDLVTDVRDMRANPASNFGWRLADAAEGSNTARELGIKSRESTSPPTLVISYSP